MNFTLPLMFCRIQRLLSGKGIKSCPFNVVIEVISRTSLPIVARVTLSKRTTETVCEQVIRNKESRIYN